MSRGLNGKECPICHSTNNKITGSRFIGGQYKRRRVCNECKVRWSTYEIKVDEYLELMAREKAIRNIGCLCELFLKSINKEVR